MDPEPLQLPFGNEAEGHRDFDLELRDDRGVKRAASKGVRGVFERIDFQRGAGERLTGTWKLRIRARNLGLGRSTAYFAAFALP